MKIIFTLVFILGLNLSPAGAWPAYIFFLTLILVEILLSQLSIKMILLRSLISLPFMLAAIPLLFTAPEPHIQLISAGKISLMISQPGLIHFASIVIKSWISILATILLTCTTSFQDLMSAFRQLGIPRILVAVLSLMWRYLSLMVDEAISLMRARNSRSGSSDNEHKSGSTLWWRGRVTGKMTGNLLLRSLERSERVYAAMASRGYDGELLRSKNEPLPRHDLVLLIVCSFIVIVILAMAFLFG